MNYVTLVTAADGTITVVEFTPRDTVTVRGPPASRED